MTDHDTEPLKNAIFVPEVIPALPEYYSIEESPEKSYKGTPKLYVLRAGIRTGDGWHAEMRHAVQDAWCDYYDQLATVRNESRKDEADHVLAWRVPSGETYTVDHLDHFVPLGDLEEITINSHSFNYEIANLLCAHCGCGAVDDEILDEYHLLNEGWGYGEDDEEGNEDGDA